MNNIVLHEINRINEIMFLNESVKPEVINESYSGPAHVIKSIKKFINSYDVKSIKTFAKKGEVLPDVKKLVNLTGNQLTRELNILLSKLDLIKLSKTLVKDGWGGKKRDEVLEKLVSKLNEKKTIAEKIKAYQSFVKEQSKKSSETYSKLKIDGLSSFNKLVDELRYANEKLFNEKLKREIGDDTYRRLRTKPLSFGEKIIKSLNGEINSNITSIRRIIARSLTSQDKLNQEFINVLDQSLTAKNLGQKTDFYIKKLSDILVSKKKTGNEDLRYMLEMIKGNLSKKTDTTSNELLKYLDDIISSGDILTKLDEISKQSKTSISGEFLNVIKKYRNMLWPLKNAEGERQWLEMIQRQIMFIINANPNLPNEIYSQLVKQGLAKTVAIRVVNSYVATLIVYPIIYAVYNVFKSIFKTLGNLFNDEITKETNYVSDYLNGAFASVSGKYWKLFPFTTFVPEFINFITDVKTLINKSPATFNKWINNLIGSDENDIEVAKEARKNVEQEKPQTGGYTNDPSGFKEYIKKEFNDNNPVISGTKDVFTYEGENFKYNNGKFE